MHTELFATGKLMKEPETKITRTGKQVTILAILVDGLKQKDGEFLPGWIRVSCFGELGEKAAALEKGNIVSVNGKPTLDVWGNKQGQEQMGLSLKADVINRLGARKPVPETTGEKQQIRKPERNWQQPVAFDDEIPF